MHRICKVLSQLNRSPDTTINVHNTTSSKAGLFGQHDVGGLSTYDTDDIHYHPAIQDDRDKTLTYWERKIDALMFLMPSKKYWAIPEVRATIERIPKSSYLNIAYYEKWMYCILMLCLQKGLFTENELLIQYQKHPQIVKLKNNSKVEVERKQKFEAGDFVQVRGVCSDEIKYESWRLYLGLIGKVHVRSPGYIINKIGIIQKYEGLFENDELKSLGIHHTKVPIYKVRFKQKDIFKDKHMINDEDTIDIEILSHWLQRVDPNEIEQQHHDHDHEHQHQNVANPVHKDREIVEQNAIDKEPELSPYQVISEVVIGILNTKGIITMDELRGFMENVDRASQYKLGPKIVIRYWRDDEFRKELMKASQLGTTNAFLAKEFDAEYLVKDYTKLKMMENTESIHNVIVCTLCSCYPRMLLGVPPKWYKSLRYRSEIISNPRRLLREEFGCDLNKGIQLNVYDSTSDLRYMVIPHLPSQINGWEKMSDKELEKIITRDMLIGVKR